MRLLVSSSDAGRGGAGAGVAVVVGVSVSQYHRRAVANASRVSHPLIRPQFPGATVWKWRIRALHYARTRGP